MSVEKKNSLAEGSIPDNVQGQPEGGEGISRRDFVRRAAQTAAFSLFGVLGLDAVMERVLERVSEVRAIEGLSAAVSAELHRHRLMHYANAEDMGVLHEIGCIQNYVCNETAVSCNNYWCGGGGQHFDCVTRGFDCSWKFDCYDFRCDASYTCLNSPVCHSNYTQIC